MLKPVLSGTLDLHRYHPILIYVCQIHWHSGVTGLEIRRGWRDGGREGGREGVAGEGREVRRREGRERKERKGGGMRDEDLGHTVLLQFVLHKEFSGVLVHTGATMHADSSALLDNYTMTLQRGGAYHIKEVKQYFNYHMYKYQNKHIL